MEKIVGTAYSKTTQINYQVKWDKSCGDVWIKDPDKVGWMLVAKEAITAEDALTLAQEVIDEQEMY